MARLMITKNFNLEDEFKKRIFNIKHAIGEYLVSSTKERFYETKRNPNGGKWRSLKMETIKKKTRSGKTGDSILIYNATLVNSVDYDIKGKDIIVGASQQYGVYHQYGTNKGLPKPNESDWRGFLGLSKDDKEEIKDLVEKGLTL